MNNLLCLGHENLFPFPLNSVQYSSGIITHARLPSPWRILALPPRFQNSNRPFNCFLKLKPDKLTHTEVSNKKKAQCEEGGDASEVRNILLKEQPTIATHRQLRGNVIISISVESQYTQPTYRPTQERKQEKNKTKRQRAQGTCKHEAVGKTVRKQWARGTCTEQGIVVSG